MSQMPNFLMIGAARTGTSSLYHYLRQHPEIFMPAIKEPHFFCFEGNPPHFTGVYDNAMWSQMLVTDLIAYQALFAESNAPARGEASTNYLYYYETSAATIRHYVPDMKLIVILRNPADRAFSAYQERRRNYRDPLMFEQALAAEAERIKTGWGPGAHYTRGGFYYDALQHYFAHFPPEQIRIYLYEQDYRDNLPAMLRDIFMFLGVNPDVQIDTAQRFNHDGVLQNPLLRLSHRLLLYADLQPMLHKLLPAALYQALRHTMYALRRNDEVKATLDERSREMLKALYRDDILKTQALIGRDLSAWLD